MSLPVVNKKESGCKGLYRRQWHDRQCATPGEDILDDFLLERVEGIESKDVF
jgi:hypothetical protein